MVYVVEREVGAGVRFNPAEVGVGLIVLLFFRLFRLEGLEHPLDCLSAPVPDELFRLIWAS